MAWRQSPAIRQALLVVVVAALFVPWPAPPVKYASAAARYQEVGPMPAAYSFEAYDADTGDFLFAIVKSFCNADTRGSDQLMRGLFGEYLDTRFTGQPDAGPVFDQETRERLQFRWEQMDRGTCEEARSDPDSILRSVTAVTGNIPTLPDVLPPGYGDQPAIALPADDLGPERIREHQVRVEGGEFDVRAWSGVGQRDGWCPDDPDGGYWWLAGGFADDRSNDDSDTYAMLCVSYRYTGLLPQSPA